MARVRLQLCALLPVLAECRTRGDWASSKYGTRCRAGKGGQAQHATSPVASTAAEAGPLGLWAQPLPGPAPACRSRLKPSRHTPAWTGRPVALGTLQLQEPLRTPLAGHAVPSWAPEPLLHVWSDHRHRQLAGLWETCWVGRHSGSTLAERGLRWCCEHRKPPSFAEGRFSH